VGVSTRKKNKILFCVIGLSIAIGLTALVLASFSWALVDYISAPHAIRTNNLASGAVTEDKIEAYAVTSSKMAAGVRLESPFLRLPTFQALNGHDFVVEPLTIYGHSGSGVALYSPSSSFNYIGIPTCPIANVYANNIIAAKMYHTASYAAGLDRASLQTRIAKTANLSAVVDALRRLTIEQSVDGEALLVADKVAESFPQATTAFEDREGDRTVYVNKEIVYDAALVALQQTMRENDGLRQEIADMRTKLESLHASVEFLLSQSIS